MESNDAIKGMFRSVISRRGHRVIQFGLALMLAFGLVGSGLAQRQGGQRRGGQGSGQNSGQGYSTIYYQNGNLKIEAYLYKPEGAGPFPVVIYNHGSRAGQERTEVPFKYVATVLVAQGYAVLVPERRGYGKSDGQTFSEEVGGDVGQKLIHRFEEESTDLIAALDYLKTVNFVDFKRKAIMGWSHGGVATILTASKREDAFRAVIDQAGGALSWKRSTALQNALTEAARKIKAPVLCMDAENDATTDAVKTVASAVRSAGTPEKTIIYPPFTPTSNPSNIAPGHLIFSAQGISIWQNDLLTFLKPHLGEHGGANR